MKWAKGSQTQLDQGDDWDVKEYAPLSDIGGSGQRSTNFIAEMMKTGTEADGQIDVKFIDDEDVEKLIKVDICFRDALEVDKVYLVRRVKLAGNGAVLKTKAMLTQAPQGYH